MTLSTALENLSRLASKPGVQSTLILSRLDGAVIRSTGLAATAASLHSQAPNTQGTTTSTDGPILGLVESVEEKAGYGTDQGEEKQGAEAVAKMVLAFVSAAGGFLREFHEGEEIQLLRLRTRKCEVVIVPDAKYLLVVVHDFPAAA